MDDLKEFLKELISMPGLSAYETPVRERIRQRWEPLVNEMTESPVGSLHALKTGSGPHPRPRILLAAHMDAIGLMVMRVTERPDLLQPGWASIAIAFHPVIVHGRRDLPGVVGVLLTVGQSQPGGQTARTSDLVVDVGLERTVHQLVRPAISSLCLRRWRCG